MRASLLGLSSACLLLTAFIPIISAVTLGQFQPIDGFSQACINAYNTPLSGCTASDFKSGSCSMTCIKFLEALTNILNSECGGTSASPNTLIGSFFENEGTSVLCPNVLSGSKEASYGPTVINGQASASATYLLDTPASAAAPSSYTSQTLPILSAAPSQFSSSTSIRSTTAGAAATTTRVAVVKTTVSSQSIPPEPSSFSSGTLSSKTSITPRPSASETTSSGGGGTGGSPLDVGSSAASHNARIEAWVLGLMAGSAGLALLL